MYNSVKIVKELHDDKNKQSIQSSDALTLTPSNVEVNSGTKDKLRVQYRLRVT